MKKQFSLIILLTLLIVGCAGDDTEENISCDLPSNFTIVNYTNLVKVDLGWDENENTTFWEIEYALQGFTQGEGTIISSEINSVTINNLSFNAAYDFYIRAKCGNVFSDWIGPVTNTPEETPQSYALMTANIKGIQYDYMVPFLWGVFTDNAVSIISYGDVEEPFLRVQGNSTPQDVTFDNSKEINLFIPESNWAVGTYNLGVDNTDNSGSPQPHVNLIYNDANQDPTQAYEGEFGELIITEFNLEDKVIKGTFEFTFTLYNVNTGETTGPFDCLDGTFEYSLDDEYFD
ncbi:MAG: hypothetical protein L3J09_01605 [Flavobacteriaceae bacterium]|nr:hypothetical protein [Flavobacteriaceae bacterium]